MTLHPWHCQMQCHCIIDAVWMTQWCCMDVRCNLIVQASMTQQCCVWCNITLHQWCNNDAMHCSMDATMLCPMQCHVKHDNDENNVCHCHIKQTQSDNKNKNGGGQWLIDDDDHTMIHNTIIIIDTMWCCVGHNIIVWCINDTMTLHLQYHWMQHCCVIDTVQMM